MNIAIPRVSGRILPALVILVCGHVPAALGADKWASVARLTSPHPAAGNHFGAAVSMSGTRLVVGEPYAANSGNSGAGNVYVYDLIGKSWQLTADIQAQTANFFSAPHAHLGAAVGVSGDRLIVGAPDADCCEPTIPGLGFTNFYGRNPTSGQWEYLSGSTDGFTANAHFGISVAIDEDIAIAGRVPDGADVGSAALWHWNGTNNWNYAGELTPAIGTNGMRFGASVAIMQSTNVPGGQLAVVGAPNYSPAGAPANSGAVFTFNLQNASWQAFKTLLDNPAAANDAFGTAVGLTQNRIVVGAPGRDSPGGTQGLGGVDVFRLSGTNFVLEDNLYTIQQSANARVGASLGITPDPISPVMVIGAPLGTASDAGSSFLFKIVHTQDGDQWIEDDRITLGSDAADNDQFGTSTAIAGKFAAVGVPLREAVPGLTDSGIVEIFTLDTIFMDGFENP